MTRMKELMALALLAAGCSEAYIAARAGAISPVSAQVQQLPTSATVGAAYGVRKDNGLGVELSADYHQSHSEDGPAEIDTSTLTTRVTVSKSFATSGRARPFAAAEALNMTEWPHISIGEPFNVDEDKAPVNTFGLGIGGGVEFELASGKSIEARIMYERFFGENVEGAVYTGVSFNF